jgi:hypothetical protein
VDADGSKTGGRQKGTPNKATAEVRALAADYGHEALKALAELAGLGKDDSGTPLPAAQSETARISAIGMLLDRAYGRAQPGRTVVVELPDTSSLEGVNSAIAALLQAAAAGNLTPGEASDFCGMLDIQRRAIELSEIEARLTALETSMGRSRAPGQMGARQ